MSNQSYEKNWHEFTLTGDPMYYLEFARNRGQLRATNDRRSDEDNKSAGLGY